MKTYRFPITVTLAGLLALAGAFSARAETGLTSFGITNTTFAASAGSSTMGGSNVKVDNYSTVDLVLTCTAVTTNASTILLTFARVDANGNVETGPRFTWEPSLPTSGTNDVVLRTVLANTTIGSATALKLISVTNVNTGGGISSLAVYAEKKTIPLRFP